MSLGSFLCCLMDLNLLLIWAASSAQQATFVGLFFADRVLVL